MYKYIYYLNVSKHQFSYLQISAHQILMVCQQILSEQIKNLKWRNGKQRNGWLWDLSGIIHLENEPHKFCWKNCEILSFFLVDTQSVNEKLFGFRIKGTKIYANNKWVQTCCAWEHQEVFTRKGIQILPCFRQV